MRKRTIIVVTIVVLFFLFISCDKYGHLQVSSVLRSNHILEKYSVSMEVIEIRGDELTVQVVNDTPYELMSGVYADLEFFCGENWRIVSHLVDIRTDLGRDWLSSRNDTFDVNLNYYATVGAGLYRVRKTFFLLEHPHEFHDVVAELYLE